MTNANKLAPPSGLESHFPHASMERNGVTSLETADVFAGRASFLFVCLFFDDVPSLKYQFHLCTLQLNQNVLHCTEVGGSSDYIQITFKEVVRNKDMYSKTKKV